MDLRQQVKQVLRMCGHAFVSTVHDRLNGIEAMLHSILEQNTHIASTQTALLQSGIHLVENLDRARKDFAEIEARLTTEIHDGFKEGRETSAAAELQRLAAAFEDLSGRCVDREELEAFRTGLQQIESRFAAQVHDYGSGNKDLLAAIAELANSQAGLTQRTSEDRAATERLKEIAGQLSRDLRANSDGIGELKSKMNAVAESSMAVLQPVAFQTKDFLETQSVRQVCMETSDYFFTNPELGLMEFLYSYLPTRMALDIGAHTGEFSEHLLNSGYEVYAFEPYPESYRRLSERLASRPEFHSFNFALGSVTGELPLYTVRDSSPDSRFEDATVFHCLAPHGMPAGLSFERAVSVPIRRLADLHRQGLVPENLSLVKIDTEGYDLEVIRGMEERHYPVVMAEFWDAEIPFATQGLRYTVKSLVGEMRQRGYLWSIVIYRIWGSNQTAFYCNHDRSAPNSWGNVVFFQDRELFSQAQQWCSAVLPRTYFRHVAPERKGRQAEESPGKVTVP